MRQTLRKSKLPMSPSVPRLTLPLVRPLRHTSRMLVAVSVVAGTLTAAAHAQQGASLLHRASRQSASARVAAENPVPSTPVLLDAMTAELHRAFTALGKDGGRQAGAAVLPQLFGQRCGHGFHPRAVWGAGRQRDEPRAGGRYPGAAGRSQARQHSRLASRLGGEQPRTAAGRRSPGAGAHVVAGHQHRLQQRARQLPARQDRSPGAGQGRR